MQKNWYIGALIIMLSLFGVIKEQQVSSPNQEIVLKFTNADISSEDIQNALESVENQLKFLGAQNIQVKKSGSGLLKISYYSDSDVSKIKQCLTDNNNVELDSFSNFPKESPFQFPSEKQDLAYQLDIHELNKTPDSGWGFDGSLTVSPEIKSDRLLHSQINFIIAWLVKDSFQLDSNIPYKFYQNIALALDDRQGNIPEVRAGPLS